MFWPWADYSKRPQKWRRVLMNFWGKPATRSKFGMALGRLGRRPHRSRPDWRGGSRRPAADSVWLLRSRPDQVSESCAHRLPGRDI